MKTIKAIAVAMNSIAVNKIIPVLSRFENNQPVYYYEQMLVEGGYKLKPATLENADVISSVDYNQDDFFEFKPGLRHHIDIDTMCDLVGCEREELEQVLRADSKAILDEIAEL